MANVTIKVTGLKEMSRMLIQLPKTIESKVVHKSLSDGAKIVAKRLKALTPVAAKDSTNNKLASRNHKKGNLKRSVGVKRVTGLGDTTYMAVAGYRTRGKHDGWYGRFIDFGTNSIRAERYTEKAFNSVGRRGGILVLKGLTSHIDKEINKLIKKR